MGYCLLGGWLRLWRDWGRRANSLGGVRRLDKRMNHYSLWAVVTLRAAALCASFQNADAFCRTGLRFSPTRSYQTRKATPKGWPFLFGRTRRIRTADLYQVKVAL